MLKQRLIFGFLLIVALLGLLYLDNHLSLPGLNAGGPQWSSDGGFFHYDGLIPSLLLVLLVCFATIELGKLIVAAGVEPLRTWPVLVNVGLILPFLALRCGSMGSIRWGVDLHYTIVALVAGLLGVGFFVAARRRTEGAINVVGATLLMILYLGLLPSFLLRLRLHAPSGAGTILLLYFVATVKFCDIGAYFTGRALGSHKLIEWLSPKKTIEGLLGGITFSIVFAVVFPLLARRFADSSSAWPQALPGPALAAFFGLTMAIVGQCGDLFESLLKRNAHAKDSSQIIPAFGGLLDVLDSLLPTAPLAYWLLLKSTN